MRTFGLVLGRLQSRVVRRRSPWAPGLLIAIDGVLTILLAHSDWTGVAFASALAVACVPLAWLARRARSGLHSVPA